MNYTSIKKILLPLLLAIALPGCGQDSNTDNKKPAAVPTLPYATVGQPAPEFPLRDAEGKTWKLADLRGKVVFVNFWATWCPPCREEMPSMERLKRSLPPDKFAMLTILSKDDLAKAADYVKRLGGTFPVLEDPEGHVGNAYGITGVPETYIIDPMGILREKFLGPRTWDSPWGRELINRYIP